MTKEEETKEVYEGKVSGAFGRRWLVYGATGVILGVVGKLAIIDYGILEEISWTLLIFFILYTSGILLIFLYLNKQSNGYSGTSQRPNGLTRFRSYLTFLPITQIIQHGDGKETQRTNEILKNQSDKLNENDLSFRIISQRELVVEAILDEYIAPWYTKISSNQTFLHQSRGILHTVFQQFGEKILQVNRTELAKEAIQTVHLHWKEYCDAAEKSVSTSTNILKCFKFVHPFLQDTAEVSKRYEEMISQILEGLVIPDLQSTLVCQFLSGILVKSFFLYYADFICQPSWINSNLITVLSSSSALAELAGSSSQNSSAPATPLPDRSPKNLPGEINSALQTPNLSECSTSGITHPTQVFLADTSIDDDSDSRYFFGKDTDTQDALLIEENHGLQEFEGRKTFEKEKVRESLVKEKTVRSPNTCVSTALGGIIPTTAFPLLPAGSYRLDHGLQGPTFEFSKPNGDDNNFIEGLKTSPNSISPSKSLATTDETSEPEKISTVNDVSYSFSHSIVINECSSADLGTSHEHPDRELSSSLSRNSTPIHYYSFDEASKRKPSQLLDSGTLSVDGAVDPQRGDRSCNHELQITKGDLEFDKKPNRSPVYEEPEDFATSIAKLRSLLEQRDSKKNLNSMEADDTSQSDMSSCASPDPNETSQENMIDGNLKSLEDIHMHDFTYDSIHDGIIGNSNNPKHITTNETDRTVHELKCHFFNIAIPKVESSNDSGGQYDFFCIQYEGVYFDEKLDDQPPKVILRTTTVKRRFKEFLLLQSKLEEHTIWKPHLKGVKAPNRWLNLSFSKADAAATRKAMLERYLQQLCYHPILGTSREILQFMAYGDDGFSLDPLDVHDPKHLLSDRLDKLARKFTGVMNSLRDVLPSFESAPHSPHSQAGTPVDNKPECSNPSFQFHEKLSPEEIIANSTTDQKWIETLARHNSGETHCLEDSDTSFPPIHGPLNNPDIVPEDPVEGTVNSTYPLAAALTQLLCDVLWLPNCRPHNASVSTFMSISGKSLENHVHETIDVFLSEEAVLGYLEWLEKSLKADPESFDELFSESITELDLKNCFRRRIPAWVRWMWGRNRLDLTIERITGFFQNPTVNHDLVLSLSELIFSKIVKGEQNISKQ